eukprot:m.265905 g.265905  ORF g.265905 m.265905 type:complete len:57 (+) comp29723_c0_seq1:81-251(+)
MVVVVAAEIGKVGDLMARASWAKAQTGQQQKAQQSDKPTASGRPAFLYNSPRSQVS